MSDMVRTGAPVILPRSELTLHRVPPTRPTRAQARPPPLDRLPEEWMGGRTHQPDATDTPSSFATMRDSFRSSSTIRSEPYSPTMSLRRRGSTISKSSSLARSLRTRSRPLYREARMRMRSARRWANNFRRRVKIKGGAPLLTPARPRRRRPVVVASASYHHHHQQHPYSSSASSPSTSFHFSPGTAARNSPPRGPQRPATTTHRRAASAAREVRWETTSGLAALLECGASAGSAAVAAAVRVCTAVVAMADARLQQLRRSISSWSLSTVKKPRISIPKLRTPSLNLFTRRKKNRVNPKDEEAAAEDVKASLLNVERAQEGDPSLGDGVDKVGGQVIHEPESATGETHPTIVLTVHHHTGVPDPTPPSPNPGLLGPNDEIEYIDSDDGEDDRCIRGASNNADYNDHWFDCKGTLSRSRENLSNIGTGEDDCPHSIYYEAADAAARSRDMESKLQKLSSKVIKDDTTGAVPKEVIEDKPSTSKIIETSKAEREISLQDAEESLGSHKARDWVRSLDDNTERRLEQWIEMQKVKNSANIPKSKSEIRLDSLDEPPGKWSTRNEIKLNAAADDDEAYAEYLQKYNNKVECAGDSVNKDDIARKESLKRVFQVRGKLANKTIVDSQQPSYKNTDIYIASAPFALANSSGQQDSQDESEDGISCASIDLEPAMELNKPIKETVKHKCETSDAIIHKTETKPLSEETPRLTTVCQTAPIPDIIINEPDNESGQDVFKEDEYLNTSVSDDYRYSSPSTENTGEDSTLQEVSWSDESNVKPHAREPQNQDLELNENDVTNSSRKDFDYSNDLQSSSSANTGNSKDLSITPVADVEGDVSLDLKKPDRKKKKYSANIPKSIKNFAGSIFSQQTDSKSRKDQIEEKDAEKKKRKSRLSPFTKDYLFKNSSKANTEDVPSDSKTSSDMTKIPSRTADIDNSCMKDADTSFTSEDINPFINQDTSTEQVPPNVNEINKIGTEAIVPDLPSSDSMKTGKGSSESLEYISPLESDEQKSISHESSPGFGNPFVEEDGLLIRKDALLAVKNMENDDTSTHYYSFLSATDDVQSLAKEPEQTENPIKGYVVQPLQEISVFHEPPRSVESTKLKQSKDETPSTCTSETSTSNTESESLTTVKSGLPKEAVNTIRGIANSSTKDVPLAVKPPMKILEVEGHSPLCLPFPISKEPVPAGIPKLKLTQDIQEPPKPSPRTKKGRYGYSTGTSTPTTPTAPVNTVPIKGIPSKQASCVSLNNNVGVKDTSVKVIESKTASAFPQSKASIGQLHKGEIERNSADSGYAGPGNNYYESEPIYWEISETKDAPPRPSPRGKKGQRTPSEQSLNVNSTVTPSKLITVTAPTAVPASGVVPSATDIPTSQDGQPIPEWINRRAPIPSPRNKKQRSLQSLPTVVPTDESMETVKKKLQSMSSVPLCKFQAPLPQTSRRNKVEEQFYSGKAASISYGFTHEPNMPGFTQEPSMPSPPIRGKKASQMSLPGAMSVEETLSRQQKRASLHEFGLTRSHAKGTAPRPPSVRRSRRRTDPTHGITPSAFRSAVQRFDADLMNLTDLLVAVGIGATSAQKSEDHLCGVLYSVHSLMGGSGHGGSWTVSSKDSSSGTPVGSNSDQKKTVTLAQVTKELQAAYQVTQETFERLVGQAKNQPPIEVQLHLTVKEAKDLRPKTVKGKTNSYATVVIPSNGDTHRTRLQKNTLDPAWNQEFILRVNNLQKDVLKLEIWHEHDSVGVQQLTAVRDIKSFGRLVKGTTDQAKHHAGHLLGKVVLQIKSMSEGGADGWYPLEKDGEISKDRGNVRLEGKVISTAEVDQEGRRSFDALLTRLVHHQLKTPNTNNEESQWSLPWNGRLSAASTAALSQHAIMLGLNEAQLQLSWWLVGSRVSTVDAAWTLSQLHRVQAALAKGTYNAEDLSELRSSLSYFVRAHAEHLKDLHVAFPSSSGVLAQNQLTFTLKALHSLQTHTASRELLNQEKILHIHEMVTSSINIHSKNWWTLLVEEQLRGVKTADEQISRVIKIVDESYLFLNQATVFYNAVFMKEMNIPYMQTTYLMVSKKINPCVRPLLMNIYNRMPALHDQEDKGDTDVQYALEVGTSLWQLYRNLGRLHQLSENLPVEARSESGVREYHRWFSKGVMRWLELAIGRALDMINKAVELDNFTPVDDFCNFSSSATDTTGIFHDVKIWWLKLMWPDPEHSAVLLAKILEDICSCGTTYSDLLRAKVDTMFHRQATDRVFITQEICVGLNNIERVRRELTGLPHHFGFDATLEEIRKLNNGAEAAAQLEATVERLIISATENMESKLNEFIEAVIDKMKPTLDRALQEACETQSESPLLEQVLDPAIQLLHSHLHTLNFQRFLWYLWDILVVLFEETVSRNAERRKASYFRGVHDLLEASLKFFSPDEGIGLDLEEARTKEYCALLELLDSLRMSTESLISKYYQERHDEQAEPSLPAKAQLVVKMLFTRPGKLIVEVIMARDMVTEGDGASVSSRGGSLHPNLHSQPMDSYVKVQLVPQEWFPSATVRKTRTQRKADPAVYEETFEYDMTRSDDGVRAGLLLLTLKDYNLGRSNTFIGEALVPLANLPCVDSSQVHTVPNSYLKMTTPGLDIGYKSLRALHLRTSDKMASSFLKKVSKRLPYVRGKGRPDDDRVRPRSPNLIDRFKFT